MNQVKLKLFFKPSKAFKFENDNSNNLNSEMKTPTKRTRNSLETQSIKMPKLDVNEIIDLISDDEVNASKCDELSDSTIKYTPEDQSSNIACNPGTINEGTTFHLTTNKSKSNDSLDSFQNMSDKSMSPSSHNSLSPKKYFSPLKKRSLINKSHIKVKKNLTNIISECKNQDVQSVMGLDDKTKFLMEVIDQCINDKGLIVLMDESSQSLLKTCKIFSNNLKSSIKLSGLNLLCRLYWRKERWYRVKELQKIITNKKPHNANVDFEQIFDCLLHNGLLSASTDAIGVINFNEYFELLHATEIKAICQEFKIKFKTKEAAKNQLKNFCNQKSISHYFGTPSQNNRERILQLMCTICGRCYKLSDDARRTFYELYNLMYLGIHRSILIENKLELMLINDKADIEKFPARELSRIDNASVVFKNRQEFQSYITANKIYEKFIRTSDTLVRRSIVEDVFIRYRNIDESDMKSYKCLPVWLRKFTPSYLYIRILESGLPDLKRKPEKEKYCKLALEILTTMISQNLFRQHKKAEWWSEMALIYDRCLNDSIKAAETVLNAFKEIKLRNYQKECLRIRARMLTKKLTNKNADTLVMALTEYAVQETLEKKFPATHVYKQPMESSGRGKKKFERRLSHEKEVMEVEEYCKMHYIEQGKYTHGEHWEGAIITTIFTLLFWDIIYAELRGFMGIFLTRYQKYPLDMFTEAFYSNRKCLIDALLDDIEKKPIGDVIDNVRNVWETRPDFELSDIQRGKNMTLEKVAAVCKCLGGRSLAAICRRLAMDYEYCHSGFPDLILWNPNTNQIMFVEVKTDTDSPSIKQIQWMEYLHSKNINTEFCYIGAKTTQSNSRNNENSQL